MDQDTFDAHTTGTRPDPTTNPAGYRTRRCSTLSGKPSDPHDALGAALIGHVRRVVFDSRGVVIDMGRTSRLFTGTARQAESCARAAPKDFSLR